MDRRVREGGGDRRVREEVGTGGSERRWGQEGSAGVREGTTGHTP